MKYVEHVKASFVGQVLNGDSLQGIGEKKKKHTLWLLSKANSLVGQFLNFRAPYESPGDFVKTQILLQ